MRSRWDWLRLLLKLRRLCEYWKRRSCQRQYWYSQTSTSLSCWKPMHPKKDWERCFHQSRMTEAIHPVAFGSRTLTPSEQNYHSSKLEFLALKWSITKHFKEYLAYALFMVHTNNNPLTYVLTTPNLDATGHCWVVSTCVLPIQLGIPKGIGQHSSWCAELSTSAVWLRDSGMISTGRSSNQHHRKRGSPHKLTPESRMWLPGWGSTSPRSQTDTSVRDRLGGGTAWGCTDMAACHKWMSMKKSITPQRRDALCLRHAWVNIWPLKKARRCFVSGTI